MRHRRRLAPMSQAIARRPRLMVGSAPDDSVPLRLRASLATIAGDDLAGVIDMTVATTRFSDAIDDLVRDVQSRTTAAIAEKHPLVADLSFTIIAMGKWGARELNYSSDIDLLFVHDISVITNRQAGLPLWPLPWPSSVLCPPGKRRSGAPRRCRPAARGLDRASLAEPRLVCAVLRQVGRALELQALLKARPVTGDPSLGDRFASMVEAVIWEQGLDVDSLRSIRKLKEQRPRPGHRTSSAHAAGSEMSSSRSSFSNWSTAASLQS